MRGHRKLTFDERQSLEQMRQEIAENDEALDAYLTDYILLRDIANKAQALITLPGIALVCDEEIELDDAVQRWKA